MAAQPNAILCCESDFGVATPKDLSVGILHPQIEPLDIETFYSATQRAMFNGLGVQHIRSQTRKDYDFCRKIGAKYQYITAGVWDQNWYTSSNPPNVSGEPYNNWTLYESRITADANYWKAKIDAGDTDLLDRITFEPWNEPDSTESGGSFWRGTLAQYKEMARRMIVCYRAVLGSRARFCGPSMQGYHDLATGAGSRRINWEHGLATELYTVSHTWERVENHWLGRVLGGGFQVADPRGVEAVVREMRADFEYDAAGSAPYQRTAMRAHEFMITELGFREEPYVFANDKIDTAIHPAQVVALVNALERAGATGVVLANCSPHADEPTGGGMWNATSAAPTVVTPRSTYLVWKLIHEMKQGRVLSWAMTARDNTAAIIDGCNACLASTTGFGGTSTTVGTDPGIISAIFYAAIPNTTSPGTGNTVRHVHRNVGRLPRFAGLSGIYATEYSLPYGTAPMTRPTLAGASVYRAFDANGHVAWNSTQDAEDTRLFRFSTAAVN